jgi:hypothetical protein
MAAVFVEEHIRRDAGRLMLLPSFEEVVDYLTHCEKVFVSSNLMINRASHVSYSPPDIVALDFGRKEIVIIDIVRAWDLAQLCNRIDQREARWYTPIRATLISQRMVTRSWTVRVLALIPEQMLPEAHCRFAGLEDVACWALEQMDWAGEGVGASSLPRKQGPGADALVVEHRESE